MILTTSNFSQVLAAPLRRSREALGLELPEAAGGPGTVPFISIVIIAIFVVILVFLTT